MRIWLLAPVLGLLAGCISPGARPMEFRCHGLLERFSERVSDDALTAAIRQNAGHDEADTDRNKAVPVDPEGRSALMFRALAEQSEMELVEPAENALLLSGGGQWGAFGAGFLSALQQGTARIRFKVVTGISTGAIQGLCVATEDWAALAEEYGISAQSDIATYSPVRGIAFRGSLYDTDPLRRRVHERLCPDGNCAAMARMLAPGRPHLLVGMVKLADGDLHVVAITGMVGAAFGPAASVMPAQAAECATAAVMASASVPVQLRPVRIDGHAYSDGGVRASVFATALASSTEAVNAVKQARNAPPLSLYVIRNGPTVVFAPEPASDGSSRARVDELPNVPNVGLRAYRTIVNQTEVASIARLRSTHPDAPIRVMTADGYSSAGEERCARPRGEDSAFNPAFMNCLIRFGRFRANGGAAPPDWIVLPRDGTAASARP